MIRSKSYSEHHNFKYLRDKSSVLEDAFVRNKLLLYKEKES